MNTNDGVDRDYVVKCYSCGSSIGAKSANRIEIEGAKGPVLVPVCDICDPGVPA